MNKAMTNPENETALYNTAPGHRASKQYPHSEKKDYKKMVEFYDKAKALGVKFSPHFIVETGKYR